MMPCIPEEGLLTLLHEECSRTTRKAVAQRCGISLQYLGDILHGRRAVSAQVALAFGFRRIVLFEPVERDGA